MCILLNNTDIPGMENLHSFDHGLSPWGWAFELSAQLYGLGHPRQPSPRATLAEVTITLFLSKIQPTVYIRIANSSQGARQLVWTSCLTSAGRVTLAKQDNFSTYKCFGSPNRDNSWPGKCPTSFPGPFPWLGGGVGKGPGIGWSHAHFRANLHGTTL